MYREEGKAVPRQTDCNRSHSRGKLVALVSGVSRVAMSASLAAGAMVAGLVVSPAAANTLSILSGPDVVADADGSRRQSTLRTDLLGAGEALLLRDDSRQERGATTRTLRFAQATGPAPAGTVASDGEALPAIEVTGQGDRRPGELSAPYAGGQVATGSSLGLLGAKDALSTPFSTVSFTSKLIEDQQARTAADTLINDASVRLTTGGDGFGDSFQIRGFAVESQDVGLNGLYGLISSNRARAVSR
jgi:iron complex outermembrane receptor protein